MKMALKSVYIAVIVSVFSGCAVFMQKPEYFPDTKYSSEEFGKDPFLFNRRIVLDSGHGGYFSGALSEKGLMEKDINLAVSLYLFGMLKDAGAQVSITKYSDFEFARDNTIDLKTRCDIVNLLSPELFISIHHNASGNKKAVHSEIYCKGNENKSSSWQFANILQSYLRRETGIQEGKLFKSNFFVLRNINAPAVLVETTFLSNKTISKKLVNISAAKKEAFAIFKAAKEYFSKNIPGITIHQDKTEYSLSPSTFSATVELKNIATSLDMNSIDLNIKAVETGDKIQCIMKQSKLDLDKGFFVFAPAQKLENGTYLLNLVCTNSEGYNSRVAISTFSVSKQIKEIRIDTMEPAYPLQKNIKLPVTARLYDIEGLAVRKHSPVFFFSKRLLLSGSETDLVNYTALNYFSLKSTGTRKGELTIKADKLIKKFTVAFSTAGFYFISETASSVSGKQIGEALISFSSGVAVMNDRNGYSIIKFAVKPEISDLLLRKNGYKVQSLNPYELFFSTSAGSQENTVYRKIYLEPELSEKLIGKRILFYLDGETDKVETLEKTMLRPGIIPVLIKKEEGEEIYDLLARMEESKPELGVWLTFGNTSKGNKKRKVSLGHYYSSTKGKKLCAILARLFATKEIRPRSDYLLAQSSFPFIHLSFESQDSLAGSVELLPNSFNEYFNNP